MRFRLAYTFAIVLICGCGGGGLTELSGTVTLNGHPVDEGTIEFLPADGNGPTAGTTIQQGKYLVAVRPGKKRVSIHGYEKRGQQRAIENDPSSPLVSILEEIVPSRFHSPSELTYDVDADETEVDFELSSPALH